MVQLFHRSCGLLCIPQLYAEQEGNVVEMKETKGPRQRAACVAYQKFPRLEFQGGRGAQSHSA